MLCARHPSKGASLLSAKQTNEVESQFRFLANALLIRGLPGDQNIVNRLRTVQPATTSPRRAPFALGGLCFVAGVVISRSSSPFCAETALNTSAMKPIVIFFLRHIPSSTNFLRDISATHPHEHQALAKQRFEDILIA
jgi:hypothetical protein